MVIWSKDVLGERWICVQTDNKEEQAKFDKRLTLVGITNKGMNTYSDMGLGWDNLGEVTEIILKEMV